MEKKENTKQSVPICKVQDEIVLLKNHEQHTH